jgi:hypothetical protein
MKLVSPESYDLGGFIGAAGEGRGVEVWIWKYSFHSLAITYALMLVYFHHFLFYSVAPWIIHSWVPGFPLTVIHPEMRHILPIQNLLLQHSIKKSQKFVKYEENKLVPMSADHMENV